MKKIFTLLCAILALICVAKPHETEIKQYNGAPSLFIDSKPLYPMVFRSWPLKGKGHKQQYEVMAEAGANIYFTYLHFGKIWKGYNKFDFSEVDRALREVSDFAPNAYIIPVISLHHDIFWWYYKNPGERTIDGLAKDKIAPVQPPYVCISFASNKFRKEAGAAIEKILEYVKNHKDADKVIGYQIGYGAYEEWIPWGLNLKKFTDFNPSYIAQFRDWLKNKYKTPDVLQANWKQPSVNFNNATPFLAKSITAQNPKSGRFIDPAHKKQMLDNREFLSELVTDTAIYFTGVIKDVSKGQKLAGIYSGANYQYQHFSRILESKNIDFICSSTGYGDRANTGVTYDQCITLESVKLHNKIYLHDADIRTYLFTKAKTAYFGGSTDFGRLNNPYDSVMTLRREWGAMLIHGFGITWLNIARTPKFYCPVIMKDIYRMDKIGKASMNFDRTSNAEIAVILRGRSNHYASFYSAGAVRSQLYRIGAPVDFYNIEDVEKIPAGKYKLIVTAYCQLLTKAERKAINKLKKKGTAFLWSLGSGYLTENAMSIKAMNKLTGFNFEKTYGDVPIMKLTNRKFKYLKRNGNFNLRGLIMGQHGSAYFNVTDKSNLQIFGKSPKGKILFAKKKFAAWTSICYPGYIIPGKIVREIAAQAGVHIYCNSDDGFYCNRNFLIVSSSERGGTKTIELPNRSYVFDAFQNKTIVENSKSFTVNQKPHETGVYFIGSKAELNNFLELYKNLDCAAKKWKWAEDKPQPKFSCFADESAIDIMHGAEKTITFRLISDGKSNKRITAQMPEGWTCKITQPVDLSKNEIAYPTVKIKVPAETKSGKYTIKVSYGNYELPVRIHVSPYTYISDMKWNKAVSGWKQVLKDKSVSGNALSIKGKKYRKGLGTHANSEVIYNLDGKWSRFEAMIGMDDRAGKGYKGRATAVFEIYGDGKKLFSSGKILGKSPAKKVSIDVKGINQLRLVTSDAGDGKAADHTNWADAKIYK